MSSFVGFWGTNTPLKNQINSILPSPEFYSESNSICIWGHGNSLTCSFHFDEINQSGWAVCGIGISSENQPIILQKNDWQQTFDSGIDLHSELNGHFAIAQWDDQQLTLTTDQIGMRNIFIYKLDDCVLFSTRMDWLLKIIPNTFINWRKFGSSWLGINPFSTGCFIQGVERLAQGGRAIISNNSLSISNKRWLPKTTESSATKAKNVLQSLTLAGHKRYGRTSIGLSGGLDSRVLYALIVSSGIKDVDAYTFVHDQHPDEVVAKKLSSLYQTPHTLFPFPRITAEQIARQLPEIAVRSLLTKSVFQVPVVQAYQSLGARNLITVDGAFGEIGRRRFLKGLELKGKQSLIARNFEALLPFFSFRKGDFFQNDLLLEMENGFKDEFEEELANMPKAEKLGLGAWLDLFTIRTRGQNLFGLGNELSDSHLFHYMPFIQPDFLNSIFGLPEKERSNARLFRTIISGSASKLTKAPLVKGNDVYPYWMTDIPSMFWMKTSRKLGLGYQDQNSVKLLLSLEDIIRDQTSSTSILDAAIFNKTNVHSIVHDFYENKNYTRVHELGWLYTFITFYQQLN